MLLEVKNGIQLLWESGAISPEVKHHKTQHLPLDVYLREKKTHVLTNVHDSSAHNSQNAEITNNAAAGEWVNKCGVHHWNTTQPLKQTQTNKGCNINKPGKHFAE